MSTKGQGQSLTLVQITYIQYFYGWGYTHDCRADKYPYPHDRRADKDSYPHNRNVTV